MGLVDTVIAIFRRNHWDFRLVSPTRILTRFEDVFMVLLVDEDDDTILLIAEVVEPRKRRRFIPEHNITEYIDAINFRHQWLGRFERDRRDGEIRYVMPIVGANGSITGDQLTRAIVAAVRAVERYRPDIIALLTRKMSLPEALRRLDSDAAA